jgi:uncharacterized protein DUF3574
MPNICVLAMCVLTLAGCAASPNPCARVGGARMLEYQLFFARGSVSEHAWTDFNAGVVTPHLPDGFTVVDADGQWMNPATHRISSERTKVIVVAVPDTPASAAAITAIKDAYRTQFHQQSVGTIIHPVCGAF